jgi:DMSO/TMAO reductase YedYZ molybdopterin-dependent catalytic subunit
MPAVLDPAKPSTPDAVRPTRWLPLLGGLAGLLAGASAVAVSEAVAALLTGVTSPLLAVGNRAVDQAPRPVKEWAISTFGTADKPVLIGGVIATVALLAVVAGVLGVRRPRAAVLLLVLLVLVAGAAALTDRSATAGPGVRLLPVLALLGVGLGALVALLRPLHGLLHASLHRSPDLPTDAATTSPRAARPRTTGGSTSNGGRLDGSAAGSDRRRFLRAAVVVAVVGAVGGAVARSYDGLAATASRAGVRLPRPRHPAPPVPAGARLDVPGLTPYLTPSADFYRVDTALRVPDVPLEGWHLRVTGLVDRELSLSFADLLERGLVERRITLTCVSNPVGGEYLGNATWLGVPIADLLAEAGVQAGADAVRSRSVDDFTAGTPLSVLTDRERGALVAVGMNGEPLPLEHGFPARMVTPGLYGYVSATKWLVELEVTRFADFQAYWTTRGYAAEAPIKTSSRIDVPRSFAHVRAGRTPVAGVAWAQARGIRTVEVRVDRGPWHDAELAAEDGVDTWRQWVWQWDATPGTHTLEVRATDADGHTQTGARAPIAPDGSTGWDSVNVTVA